MIPATIHFPPELPITQKKDEIAHLIARHPVVIVCGETGSGKTTQLPKICLELGRAKHKMIGHTQPRRIAARTVAARIANELSVNIGDLVGYKIRFNDRSSRSTRIKVMTDGILLAETQRDRLLRQYDTLIIDEAHERSLNIDFLLGYIRQLLPKRPDLRVIITSATIDPQRFSRHFDDAPIIEVSGRVFPVEVRYRPLQSIEELEHDDNDISAPSGSSGTNRDDDLDPIDGILRAIDVLWSTDRGDTLVFLPGEREIRDTTEALRKFHSSEVEVLPLYGRLSSEQQMKIFQPSHKPRIVLATNVAETSITVPGIRYVVDTGLARISRYSARTKVQRLPIEAISQASANQRKGRCGRVSDGVCIRLYSQEDFAARPAFTEPEILRASLASVILQMKFLNLGAIEDFPFIDPPDARQVRDGYHTLRELAAIDERNNLTAVGRALAHLPIDPRIGRMILHSIDEDCVEEVLIIAAALSVQDPRDRPMDRADAADQAHAKYRDETSDFLSFLRLWNFAQRKEDEHSARQFRKFCRENFLSFFRLREWQDVRSQLAQLIHDRKHHPHHHRGDTVAVDELSPQKHAGIHRSLLAGLLSNIGAKGETHEYIGARGTKMSIFPGSSLFKSKPQWIAAAEIVETSKLWARTIAPVRPEWIEQLAAHLVRRQYFEPHWQSKSAHVVAYEKVTLYGLVLVEKRLVHFGPIDPVISRRIFIENALVETDFKTSAPYMKHNRALVAQIESLEAKSRKRDVLADAEVIAAFFEMRVPADIYNGPLLDRWRKVAERDRPDVLFLRRSDVLKRDPIEITPELFPDFLDMNGARIALEYRFDMASRADGITAIIPIALLAQIPSERFDWLVPGFLPEKILALIRSLPKQLRTLLIPNAEVADESAKALSSAQGPLLDALSIHLGKRAGVVFPRNSFDPKSLPPHLHMNFRVIDEHGKAIAEGRDLDDIRRELRIEIRQTLETLPRSPFHRDEVRRWDFGDLPEKIEVKRHGIALAGFPALVEEGRKVAIRTLESPQAAVLATRGGVRRLFMTQIQPELRRIVRSLPGIESIALHYAIIGKSDDLRSDLASAIADRALGLAGFPVDLRTRDEFVALAERGWKALGQASQELGAAIAPTLENYHAIIERLNATYGVALQPSINDMRQQIARMIYPDFIAVTPFDWLQHLPRFVSAIDIRLKKLLNAGLNRDLQQMSLVAPFVQRYLERRRLRTSEGLAPDRALETFGWMIEEFRVSVFAQELKTSIPISEKRLETQWESVA